MTSFYYISHNLYFYQVLVLRMLLVHTLDLKPLFYIFLCKWKPISWEFFAFSLMWSQFRIVQTFLCKMKAIFFTRLRSRIMHSLNYIIMINLISMKFFCTIMYQYQVVKQIAQNGVEWWHIYNASTTVTYVNPYNHSKPSKSDLTLYPLISAPSSKASCKAII